LEFIVSYDFVLRRENRNVRVSGNTETRTSDIVSFVYVDRDVTVSREEQGWNAVRHIGSETSGPSGITETITISLGNPNVNWVLND